MHEIRSNMRALQYLYNIWCGIVLQYGFNALPHDQGTRVLTIPNPKNPAPLASRLRRFTSLAPNTPLTLPSIKFLPSPCP